MSYKYKSPSPRLQKPHTVVTQAQVHCPKLQLTVAESPSALKKRKIMHELSTTSGYVSTIQNNENLNTKETTPKQSDADTVTINASDYNALFDDLLNMSTTLDANIVPTSSCYRSSEAGTPVSVVQVPPGLNFKPYHEKKKKKKPMNQKELFFKLYEEEHSKVLELMKFKESYKELEEKAKLLESSEVNLKLLKNQLEAKLLCKTEKCQTLEMNSNEASITKAEIRLNEVWKGFCHYVENPKSYAQKDFAQYKQAFNKVLKEKEGLERFMNLPILNCDTVIKRGRKSQQKNNIGTSVTSVSGEEVKFPVGLLSPPCSDNTGENTNDSFDAIAQDKISTGLNQLLKEHFENNKKNFDEKFENLFEKKVETMLEKLFDQMSSFENNNKLLRTEIEDMKTLFNTENEKNLKILSAEINGVKKETTLIGEEFKKLRNDIVKENCKLISSYKENCEIEKCLREMKNDSCSLLSPIKSVDDHNFYTENLSKVENVAPSMSTVNENKQVSDMWDDSLEYTMVENIGRDELPQTFEELESKIPQRDMLNRENQSSQNIVENEISNKLEFKFNNDQSDHGIIKLENEGNQFCKDDECKTLGKNFQVISHKQTQLAKGNSAVKSFSIFDDEDDDVKNNLSDSVKPDTEGTRNSPSEHTVVECTNKNKFAQKLEKFRYPKLNSEDLPSQNIVENENNNKLGFRLNNDQGFRLNNDQSDCRMVKLEDERNQFGKGDTCKSLDKNVQCKSEEIFDLNHVQSQLSELGNSTIKSFSIFDDEDEDVTNKSKSNLGDNVKPNIEETKGSCLEYTNAESIFESQLIKKRQEIKLEKPQQDCLSGKFKSSQISNSDMSKKLRSYREQSHDRILKDNETNKCSVDNPAESPKKHVQNLTKKLYSGRKIKVIQLPEISIAAVKSRHTLNSAVNEKKNKNCRNMGKTFNLNTKSSHKPEVDKTLAIGESVNNIKQENEVFAPGLVRSQKQKYKPMIEDQFEQCEVNSKTDMGAKKE